MPGYARATASEIVVGETWPLLNHGLRKSLSPSAHPRIKTGRKYGRTRKAEITAQQLRSTTSDAPRSDLRDQSLPRAAGASQDEAPYARYSQEKIPTYTPREFSARSAGTCPQASPPRARNTIGPLICASIPPGTACTRECPILAPHTSAEFDSHAIVP